MSNAQVKIREQLDILIALQTATNAKLDAILLASAPPAGGNNTTLADVVQALNIIHSDMMDIDDRLVTQRNLLAELVNNLGQPTGDATTTVAGRLTATQNLLAELVNNLGQPTGDATTTVAGRLTAIQNLLASPAGGAPWFPAGANDETASNFNIAGAPGSLDSLWVWEFATGEASVSLAPAGTSAAGVNSEFLQAADWTGWQFYAACGATPVQEVSDLNDGNGTIVRDVAANRWHPVTAGAGLRGWRKPGLDLQNGEIQALYLQPPADGGGFGPGTSSGGPF